MKLPGLATIVPLRVRLAQCESDLRAAQRLRYEVFNLEMNEGFESSHASGLDEDPFDAVCDHLLLEENHGGRVIGTYRMQTGASAARQLGYYSEQEFDFAPYEPYRGEMVELGRACVAKGHRNPVTLALLWRALSIYATERGARYFIGCSSLTSQDPRDGATAYSQLLRSSQADPEFRTEPKPEFRCPLDAVSETPYPLPKLLRAYVALGARIAGPPAIDRAFGTIDFLTILDLQRLPRQVRRRYFGLD